MVPGNRVEPGRELRLPPKRPQVLEGLEEHFLREVGGGIDIPGHPIAPCRNPGKMPLEQLIEGLVSFLAARNAMAVDEFLVREILHRTNCRLTTLGRFFAAAGTEIL